MKKQRFLFFVLLVILVLGVILAPVSATSCGHGKCPTKTKTPVWPTLPPWPTLPTKPPVVTKTPGPPTVTPDPTGTPVVTETPEPPVVTPQQPVEQQHCNLLCYSVECDDTTGGTEEWCKAIRPVDATTINEIHTRTNPCDAWHDCGLVLPDSRKIYATGLIEFVAVIGDEIMTSHFDEDLQLQVIYDLPVDKNISYEDADGNPLRIYTVSSRRGYPPLFVEEVVCELPF